MKIIFRTFSLLFCRIQIYLNYLIQHTIINIFKHVVVFGCFGIFFITHILLGSFRGIVICAYGRFNRFLLFDCLNFFDSLDKFILFRNIFFLNKFDFLILDLLILMVYVHFALCFINRLFLSSFTLMINPLLFL